MDRYQSPLGERYASDEMGHLFSPQFKYSTWRKLWIALAEAEAELGLPISEKQIEELKTHIYDIDFEKVAEYEKELHHDVMAHIRAYGDQCSMARRVIHLGATSCYVTDNTDVIQLKNGLELIQSNLRVLIEHLSNFAKKTANIPCLGYTHFQPAQLTTVGKRACLWLQDFVIDLEELEFRLSKLKFLGVKGATGTQASFLSLFSGNSDKVEALDQRVAEIMGFDKLFSISGQTYTRKQDALVLNTLASIATSAHKMGNDIRLLANLQEVEEAFGAKQVGSSAMPYKRNPILSERICSLSRFLVSLSENPTYTACTQWLERSLDDSANRRLCLSEAFLTCDSILNLLMKIVPNLIVNEGVIARRVEKELPFMATENILMAAVKKGGDRQELHERLREYSHDAALAVKQQGRDNDLILKIANDSAFGLDQQELEKILTVRHFIGRAPEQVYHYLETVNAPCLEPV